MKIHYLIFGCFLLSGCASFNGSSPYLFNVSNANHKKEFIGRSAGEMIEALGSPRTVLTEKPHQVWTYRERSCITLVYFDASEKVCFAEERGSCQNESLQNAVQTLEITQEG